jgi:hypothetical protein
MDSFLKVHAADILGTLSTFDRLVFKGHLSRFFPRAGSACSWPGGRAAEGVQAVRPTYHRGSEGPRAADGRGGGSSLHVPGVGDDEAAWAPRRRTWPARSPSATASGSGSCACSACWSAALRQRPGAPCPHPTASGTSARDTAHPSGPGPRASVPARPRPPRCAACPAPASEAARTCQVPADGMDSPSGVAALCHLS